MLVFLILMQRIRTGFKLRDVERKNKDKSNGKCKEKENQTKEKDNQAKINKSNDRLKMNKNTYFKT